MIWNISIARSKGFSLVDENTLERPDCKIEYSSKRKQPFKIYDRKLDKRGNVVSESVKFAATFYGAMRGII